MKTKITKAESSITLPDIQQIESQFNFTMPENAPLPHESLRVAFYFNKLSLKSFIFIKNRKMSRRNSKIMQGCFISFAERPHERIRAAAGAIC